MRLGDLSGPRIILGRLDPISYDWQCLSRRLSAERLMGAGSRNASRGAHDRYHCKGHDWSGRMWLTDIWKKSGFRRNWRMVERVISRLDEDPQLPDAIRSLQAWRRPAQRKALAAAVGEP